MSIDLKSENLALRENANICHESAEDWYNSFGDYSHTEAYGDLEVQVVEYQWLDDGESYAAEKIRESLPLLDSDEIRDLVSQALGVREIAEGVVSQLESAVESYQNGDLDGVIEHLQSASSQENNYGDDPATSELADKLLQEKDEEEHCTYY